MGLFTILIIVVIAVSAVIVYRKGIIPMLEKERIADEALKERLEQQKEREALEARAASGDKDAIQELEILKRQKRITQLDSDMAFWARMINRGASQQQLFGSDTFNRHGGDTRMAEYESNIIKLYDEKFALQNEIDDLKKMAKG